MKRTSKYLIPVLCALLAAACDLKEERSHDEPADTRLMRVMDEYAEALVSAPNGWILVNDSKYGAFRHYLSFDDKGRVVMLSDLSANYTLKDGTDTTAEPRESAYQLKALHMPSLLFVTYNYINMLCDPTYSVMDVPTHYALYADFEFSILSFDSGTFTLRGTLNNTTAYLRRATADEAAAIFGEQALSNDYARMEGHTRCTLDIEGRQVAVSFLEAMHAPLTSNRNRFVTLTWDEPAGTDANGQELASEPQSVEGHLWIEPETRNAAGSEAPSRIGLIAPVRAAGVELASFRWNGETGAYDALSTDGRVFTRPEATNQ